LLGDLQQFGRDFARITVLALADVIVEQAGKNGNRSLSVSKLFGAWWKAAFG
jgi:hypothetical protein